MSSHKIHSSHDDSDHEHHDHQNVLHVTNSMDKMIRVYNKRWLILFLFVATSASNAIHWTNYAIIANISMKYYRVSALAVNWSSMIFMAMYIPLVIPAMFILDRRGLKFSLLVSVSLICIGAWLKLLTLERNRFYVVFIAQGIVGAAQIFILSVPARLASIWFDAKQVSTACAIGVFGNQLGVALGFAIPPEMVNESNDMNSIRNDLWTLYLSYAIPPTFLLLLIAIFYENTPPQPPSVSQATRRLAKQKKLMEQKEARERRKANEPDTRQKKPNHFKELFKNKDYVLLLFSYGINVGVFYAYSTLLNQLYLIHYPRGEKDAGFIGLTLIVGGMTGSVVWGIFLDKTHMFRLATLIVYTFAFTGMLGFTLSLYFEVYYGVYISSGFLGFFMNGFLTVAFEFATELTYPIPESTSTGILNAVGELLGLIMVLVYGVVLDHFQDLPANSGMTGILLVGLLISFFISGKNLKRFDLNQQPLQPLHRNYSIRR